MKPELEMLTGLAGYRSDIQRAGYRGMVVIAGEMSWCQVMAKEMMLKNGSALWVGNLKIEGVESARAAECLQHLGREHTDVVYDTWQGLDPDALGVISGTVKSGSILFLLTPAFDKWEEYSDPEYERIRVEPFTVSDIGRRYIRHVVNVLDNNDEIVICKQGSGINDVQLSALKQKEYSTHGPYKTHDQQLAVEAVLHVATGHRRRPLLLLADRGRGKSSALGLAAAEYMKTCSGRIIITAPSRQQVDEIYARIKEIHNDIQLHGNVITSQNCRVEFIGPDELILHQPDAQLVMVDEAAAIPLSMLESILTIYSRVVFSTTVHGYEGTGKGFSIRFSRVLKKHCEKWVSLTMQRPIRWSSGDVLEKIINDLLLLDAEYKQKKEKYNESDISIRHIDRESLVNNNTELREWFGLLINAHYKTRPYDLRQILDGPNIEVWSVYIKGSIVATAVVGMEGINITPDLISDIYSGKRRLRGHLMPQTLISHAGLYKALDYTYARVVRIAVAEQYRRSGIGKQLVQEIETWTRQNKDFMAVSFAADSGVIKFWHKCEFTPVRVGIKKESSSGRHNIMMLKAISERSMGFLSQASNKFVADLPYLLAQPLDDIDAKYIIALSGRYSDGELNPDIRQTLMTFTESHRLYESCIRELNILLVHSLFARNTDFDTNESRAISILINVVFQGYDTATVVKKYGFTGKPELLMMIRAAVKLLLEKFV